MGVSRYLRTALLVAATLSSLFDPVASTSSSSSSSVVFSSCIDRCIGTGACGLSSPRCMCKASRSSFLDNVLVCMFHHCTNELENAEALFLEPMQFGCANIRKPIPDDDIEEAERVLRFLLGKLSRQTSTSEDVPKSTATRPQRTTTRTEKTTTELTTTSTSSSSVNSSIVTSTTTNSPAQTTSDQPVDSATQTSSQSSASTQQTFNPDPFALPQNAATMRSTGSYLWAGLPLAIAIALR